MLREGGRSTRCVATCCHSTLLVDHPNYFGKTVMLFPEALVDIAGSLNRRPVDARIYMKDFPASKMNALPPWDGPTLTGNEGPEAMMPYRQLVSDEVPLPREGVSVQELIASGGTVTVLGLEEGFD
jgi:hypothetical protein